MTSRPRPPYGRRLTATALGMATALTLTACGGGKASDGANGEGSASAAPQGVVTEKAAAAVMDKYEKVNNKANAALDEKLLGTVEGGQVYAMDKATYTLVPTFSAKDRKAYGKPFSYQDRQYVIPEKGTGDWFAVRASSSENAKSSVLLVFDKVDGTYKMVLSLWADSGEPFPELAVGQGGLAQAVSADTKVGKLAPSDVATAYEDLLATGGTKEGKSLASTEPVKNALKTYKKSSTEGGADGAATEKFFTKPPADPSVYALRTADGGILALFAASHTQETLLKPAYRSNASLVPSDEQAALGATRGAVITDEFQGQGVAELTPKAARITAVDFQHVDSR
ncbi:hypothetical protein [Streptomyces sp. S.PB5]|uniref:hypothetical protein n=1 Tax=Streptomyces sp. S.PB5 TaxID=3020844 RepID=UPI0025B0876C|nr:hypothetical protein [Streptomyces sp. S.PB5]MDN3024787.1 hypothetical protein [Streptomyces sp. S.PB5]